MIAELMVYSTITSALVSLAALMVERAVTVLTWPRRWLWATAMLICLGSPAVMTVGVHLSSLHPIDSTSAAAPAAAPQTKAPPFVALPEAAPSRLMRSRQIISFAGLLETPLKWAWLGASCLLVGLYVVAGSRLGQAKRGWQRRTVCGNSVLIAERAGPAVVGLFHPEIVLPRWLLAGPAASRDIALLHEQEHIAARDPRLLLGALLLLALTPWNLPLWWQLRRLKLAIEVDCDRRVLGRGVDRRDYGYALLQINQCTERMPIAAIAIVGRVSQIEQRIGIMIAERPKNPPLWIAVWAIAAIPVLVIAAQIEPPPAGPLVAQSGARHALLGIDIADFDINGAAKTISARHAGALVTSVKPGSAADLAGIRKGDVVLKYNNTPISGQLALMTEVVHTDPDSSVSLVIQRGPDAHAAFKVVVNFPAPRPPSPTMQAVDASDWDTLRDQGLSIKDPTLQTELIQMSGLDQLQAMQSRLSKERPLPPNTSGISMSSPSFSPGARANVRRLQAIIAQRGWPTISMVGVRGARAAALIALLSSDPGFRVRALALMEPLLPRDEVPVAEYALLYDAVHTPQRFGTQMACKNGVNSPTKPVEDPDHLDERRTALGLMKLPKFCANSELPARRPG